MEKKFCSPEIDILEIKLEASLLTNSDPEVRGGFEPEEITQGEW